MALPFFAIGDYCYESNIQLYSQIVAIFICNLWHWHLYYISLLSPTPSIKEYIIALHSGFLQTEPHDSALAFG
jgi:hypothetical protein